MYLEAHSLGIRFGKNWLFRNIDLNLNPGDSLAILGANGSGKSTLVKILTAFQVPSEGKVSWRFPNNTHIPDASLYRYYSLAAPYLELFEELTLKEAYHFHAQLKPMQMSYAEMLETGYFTGHQDKPVKQFSSGMKQRLKLLLAFGGTSQLIVLDEPCSNLDTRGKLLYRELIEKHAGKTSMIVASNDPDEYYFCGNQLELK